VETVYLALRVLLSLAVVLGLLWMVQRRLTRNGRLSGAVKQVTVVTRQSIAPKASVVVIEAEGQRFLLGVTEQSVTVLSTTDAPQPAAVETVPRAPHSVKSLFSSGATPVMQARPHPADGAAFARVLSEQIPTTEITPPPAFRPRDNRRSKDVLDGSILSPNTWNRTATALRRFW